MGRLSKEKIRRKVIPFKNIYCPKFLAKQYDSFSAILLEYDIIHNTILSALDPLQFEKQIKKLQNKCHHFFYRTCISPEKYDEKNLSIVQASFKTLFTLSKKLNEDALKLNCYLNPVKGKKEGVHKRLRTGSLKLPPTFAAELQFAEDNEAADEGKILIPPSGRKFFLSSPAVASSLAAVDCPSISVNVSMVDDVSLAVFFDGQLAHLQECTNRKGILDCQSFGSPIFSPVVYTGNSINQRAMCRKCNCCGAFIYVPTASKVNLKEEKEEKSENLQSVSTVFAILIAGN